MRRYGGFVGHLMPQGDGGESRAFDSPNEFELLSVVPRAVDEDIGVVFSVAQVRKTNGKREAKQ